MEKPDLTLLPGILEDIPLAPLTTMHAGGSARYFFKPGSTDSIINAVEWAEKSGIDIFILGNGSNIIVSDNGIDKLVLNIGENFSNIKWEDDKAIVTAGTKLETLIHQSNKKGMANLEYFAGIPGTVGGAVYMNAGAFDHCISEFINSVKSIKNGKIITRDIKNLRFDYRKSNFTNSNEIILEIEFKFKMGDPIQLEKESENILKLRSEKQPANVYCAGSIFKRPEGHFAGALIEQSGLKGKRIGGAEVSIKHAGFIINKGNATALDIHNLVKYIQAAVKEKTNIDLETEVIFIGEF